MSLETVLYDLHDGIARIRINRPHRLNAMVSIGLAEPLVARGNPSARVVIHIEGRVAEMQLSDFAARDTRDAIRLGEWRVRPRAPAGARPRDAEQTVLHEVITAHLEGFLSAVAEEMCWR